MRFIIAVLFVMALSSLLLAASTLVPGLFPSFDSSVASASDRLVMAQLAIEVATLTALVLAAWEFMQARRKPDLAVWLQPMKEGSDTGSPTKLSKENWVYSGFRSGVGNIYAFRFRLLLENRGSAAAKYVKVSVEMLEARSAAAEPELYRQTEVHAAGKWVPLGVNSRSRMHVFHSGDDLIIYTHPKNIEDARSWMDDLGVFELHLPVAKGQEPDAEATISCTLHADNMEMRIEPLKFRVQ